MLALKGLCFAMGDNLFRCSQNKIKYKHINSELNQGEPKY